MTKGLIKKLDQAKKASRALAVAEETLRNKALQSIAYELERQTELILRENAKDIKKRKQNDPLIDRLLLTSDRIKEIARGVREVAAEQNPLGRIYDCRRRQGLKICKMRVPLGVVGIIYESRPNVTVDIAALCLKSGNAVVLKGGEESDYSNKILAKIIRQALVKSKLPVDCVVLLDSYDRQGVAAMLRAVDYVDVIIPRGGRGLIDFVRREALVPIIETGAGVCHIYVDAGAAREMASDIVFNAKTQRPTVCNALDTLIINKKSLPLLMFIAKKLQTKGVIIRADMQSFILLKKIYPKELLKQAREDDFGKEYLSLEMSIKTVRDLDEALDHIQKYSSGHSEAIITNNKQHAEQFLAEVDSAAVYKNASTRFTDGSVFGLGAEIGISTQKLHARGPMGVEELTTYKWLIEGKGAVRK